MNEKKYVIATIKIPMEISSNGKYESLTDYLSIDFIHCDKLPEKQVNGNNVANEKFKNIISELFSKPQEDRKDRKDQDQEPRQQQQDQEFKLTINVGELQHPRKRSQNTSFKNQKTTGHKYSIKNRTNLLTNSNKDVGLS